MKHLHNKQHSQVAAFVISFLVILFAGNPAGAQCDTFYNADAANQVLNTFPYPVFPTGLVFTDIDNDGDLDCYFLNNGTAFNPLENKGNAKHPLLDATSLDAVFLYPHSLYDNWYTQDFEFADLDGDGDKDIFLSQLFHFSHGTSVNVYDTGFFYWQNTGTPAAPSFSENDAANPLPRFLADSVRGGVFTFYDIDEDGDLDFTYASNPNYDYKIYLNTGSKKAPQFTYYTKVPAALYGKPQYFDWNEDGLPDLLIATNLYLNAGTLAHPSFVPAFASPVFNNGVPYILTDLNADQKPEAYTFGANLSTPVPVPVIDTTVQKIGLRTFVKYYTCQQLPGYQYSWTYNGKPISGYHKPFIFAEKKGAYSLEITNGCGTGVSLPHFTYNRYQAPPLFAVNDNRIGIASLPQPAPVVVTAYPNPFSREVTVRFPQGNAKSTVIITDIAGRLLSTQVTSAAMLTTGGSLPGGMYLLQVWQGGKCVYHITILKQ